MGALGVKTLCRLQSMQGKAERIYIYMGLSFDIFQVLTNTSYILRECKTLSTMFFFYHKYYVLLNARNERVIVMIMD